MTAKNERSKPPAVAGQSPSKDAVDAAKTAAAAKPPAEDAPSKRKKRSEELVSMTVNQPFKLQHDDGTFTEYDVGIQDMPESHAGHWYTQHHAERNED